LPRALELQLVQTNVDNLMRQFWRSPILREKGYLSPLAGSRLKHFDASAPGCLLTVVDLAQVQYRSLDDSSALATAILNDAPIPM